MLSAKSFRLQCSNQEGIELSLLSAFFVLAMLLIAIPMIDSYYLDKLLEEEILVGDYVNLRLYYNALFIPITILFFVLTKVSISDKWKLTLYNIVLLRFLSLNLVLTDLAIRLLKFDTFFRYIALIAAIVVILVARSRIKDTRDNVLDDDLIKEIIEE